MHHLVTGVAGFIGFHAAQVLLARGDSVVGVDNLNDYYDPALKRARLALLQGKPGFRCERFDLADRAATARLSLRKNSLARSTWQRRRGARSSDPAADQMPARRDRSGSPSVRGLVPSRYLV